MVNRRVMNTALMVALAMMGVPEDPPRRPDDEDLSKVPPDESELGPNGIQRKKPKEGL